MQNESYEELRPPASATRLTPSAMQCSASVSFLLWQHALIGSHFKYQRLQETHMRWAKAGILFLDSGSKWLSLYDITFKCLSDYITSPRGQALLVAKTVPY